jgi:hypothetical protein
MVGSGGGAAGLTGGGAGGGAISLEADGNGTLTIQSGATISANGGGVASTQVNGGGGGSGGSIRLVGKTITNSGSIQAKGGTPPSTTSTYDGGIGGGGRVSFSYSGNLNEGNVDVGTGAQQGTKGYNTPPTISSTLTASVAYSNINYQKRSATRYDDLVLWYTFDEADGSMALDYSSSERNATLKNMSASNRVAGKMGGALSFDTTSTKLSSDPSGQYLDLGTWSFGGAFTLSTWIKADEWRSNGTILSLAGSEIMQLRYKSVNERKLYFLLDGTAGGLENIDTGDVLDWGKWIHLAITLENGGTNTSTSRVYKNGTLFATATDKTTPDSATRTPQYIGRSHSNSERYFAGDLDDFRLYNSALSAGDISNIYGELAAGIHYQAQALNNPTSFSANGLPSGLTIDPNTGAITGHTTAVGDHNITLTASNLSGTSPSKVVTLSVTADKPLFYLQAINPDISNISGLQLWLDASDLSTPGGSWADKSGNGNSATKHGTPTITTGAQNGLSVMYYNGGGDYHTFTNIADIRTVFWVVSRDVGVSNNYRHLLSGANSAHFHGTNNGKFWTGSANAHVRNGSTRMNGTLLTGDTSHPTTLSIISLRTSGNVEADRFGVDRGYTSLNRYWIGNLGELLIYNNALSDAEILTVEAYLAKKWGIGSINTTEPKILTSAVGSNSATATVTLLETGGTDTDLEVFYGISDKGTTTTASPSDYSALKLWLDAADSSTITKDGSNKISAWNDKSGNSFNLSQSTSGSQPTYDATNSKVTFSSDFLSGTAPTLSQPLTFFTVLEYSGSNTNGQYVHDSSTGRYVFGEWSSQGWGLNRGDSSLKSSTLNPTTKSVFSYQFDGSSSAVFINGNQELSGTHPTDNLGGNYVIGAHHDGSQAPFQGSIYEHLIISNISSQDRQNIEGYLARKWGIALDSSHTAWHKSTKLPDAQNPGDIELGMTGLSASTSYVYRIRASNSAGSIWSNAIKFTTGAQLQPPAISSADASNVAGTSATTNGNLLSFDGNDQPTVTVFYDTEANVTAGRADPYLPLSLSNTLKIWLDAEDANSFQLSGSNITKWYNKAGNGYIFDQKTGDPTRTVVNGKNVVNLDGNDQLWTNDAFLATSYTIMSVSRLTGGQNARLISSKDNNWLAGYWSGRVDAFYFNGWLNMGGTYNADTNWHLHAVTMNNSDQGNTWVDAVQTTTNGNGAHNSTYAPSKISFGANGNLSEASKGEIAELLVFDSVLSTADREMIEGYLAQKWSLNTGKVLTNANTIVEATSTNWPQQHKPIYTLDGNTGTKYFNSDGPGEGLYLFTGPKGVTGFSVTSADASYRDPTSYTIHGSDNNVTYTQISSGSIPSFSARNQKKSVSFSNSSIYSKYKIIFPTISGNSNDALAFAEIELLGYESPLRQVPTTSVSLGQKPVGTFTGALSNLQSGTTYNYRFAATNPGGVDISAIKTFTTLGLPKIENPGATEITKTSAKLNAKLTFTNGNDSNVTFYWGDNNGSNNGNHNQWDNPLASSTNQGVGVVGQSISGLSTGTTYYYTAKAVNAQGTAWGTVKTFVPANTAINKFSIPDLALWLDATDLDGNGAADSVSNGSALPSWTDKSVTPKTVNQTSSTEQPIVISNAIGGKSVVRFDGNGDVLNVSSIRTDAGSYSIYAITQRISESGDTNGHLASEPTWALIPSATADSFSAQVAKNSASSGASLTNIKLGKSGSSTSNDFGGDLAELLIFSRQLSSTEEQKVEGYLAHKWGVANTLDSNHTYKDVPPIFDNGPVITSQYYFTGEASQEVIKVDFGQNTPAPLQAGYVGFNPWGSTSVDNGNSAMQTYVNSYASNNSLKLSVQGQSHWRDYNSILQQPHDLLSNLLSDEVLSNAGGTIIITLSGLKTGQYSISTYHHASEGNGNNTYNLKATDASGANRLVASSMTSSGGRYPSSINKKTFDLLSNGKNEVQVVVGPGGSNGNHLVVNGFDLLQQNYKVIQTGENVSMQVPATRNPTSWVASGLASGLTINNSGVISGTTTFIGDFNATVTAINSDGNDSKVIQFRSIKGQRIIAWDQNFTNITYGDAPITLNATATGTGDLNYTSSDSQIIEINGTSAIIRGGGSVTLTANAAENSTAFAAVPVSKTFSIFRAPLTITGQDLTLPVGTSIPDLNYTATGWKHNDASSPTSTIFSTAPTVTTDATNSSNAGTYYIRPGGAVSKKYSFIYADGNLVLSSLTPQTITWGQNFSGVGVGQTVDLNASASSNLSMLYSVSDSSVAELAVTNQSSLHAWYKLDETGGVDAIDSSVYGSSAGHKGSLRNATGTPWNSGKFANAITLDGSNDHIRDYNFQGITGNARRTIALWFKTSTANKPFTSVRCIRNGYPVQIIPEWIGGSRT